MTNSNFALTQPSRLLSGVLALALVLATSSAFAQEFMLHNPNAPTDPNEQGMALVSPQRVVIAAGNNRPEAFQRAPQHDDAAAIGYVEPLSSTILRWPRNVNDAIYFEFFPAPGQRHVMKAPWRIIPSQNFGAQPAMGGFAQPQPAMGGYPQPGPFGQPGGAYQAPPFPQPGMTPQMGGMIQPGVFPQHAGGFQAAPYPQQGAYPQMGGMIQPIVVNQPVEDVRVVPRPVLEPVEVEFHNSHRHDVVVQLNQRGSKGSRPIEFEIPAGESVKKRIPRDAGAVKQRVLVGVNGEVQVLGEQPVSARSLYDVAVHEHKVTSVYFDRTKRGREIYGNKPVSSKKSKVSLGVFKLPAGDQLGQGSRIDVYREAKSHGNPGAVRHYPPICDPVKRSLEPANGQVIPTTNEPSQPNRQVESIHD